MTPASNLAGMDKLISLLNVGSPMRNAAVKFRGDGKADGYKGGDAKGELEGATAILKHLQSLYGKQVVGSACSVIGPLTDAVGKDAVGNDAVGKDAVGKEAVANVSKDRLGAVQKSKASNQ